MSIHSNTQFPIQVIIGEIVWRSKHSFPISNKISEIRRRLLDLLVPGSCPDQIYRVGREVIKNKVDFLFFFLTHGNLSKQTVGIEVKKIKSFLG